MFTNSHVQEATERRLQRFPGIALSGMLIVLAVLILLAALFIRSSVIKAILIAYIILP